MISSQVQDLAHFILEKLQRRDAIFSKNFVEPIIIQTPTTQETFSYTELCYSLALILKNYHQIPQSYIHYYIKGYSTQDQHTSPRKKRLLKGCLRGMVNDEMYLAGGSFASTKMKVIDQQRVVQKIAENNPSLKLANELSFLIKLSKNKRSLAHLPRVINSKVRPGFTSMVLQYYPIDTLTYKLLFGKIAAEQAWQITKAVLDFVQGTLWTQDLVQCPSTFIKDFYIKRIRENITLLTDLKPEFKQIVNKPEIYINGKAYQNLLTIVEFLENHPQLHKSLIPTHLSCIWGDLHPNNILVDDHNNFILIDPRGNDGDYLYDLGKIYHTYGPGRYDHIDNDLYNTSSKVTEGKVYIRRNFLTSHPSWKIYNNLQKKFTSSLSAYIKVDETNFELRWNFVNFCIFATMPPFLVREGDPDGLRVIMGYTNAVIMGNTFMERAQQYILYENSARSGPSTLAP